MNDKNRKHKEPRTKSFFNGKRMQILYHERKTRLAKKIELGYDGRVRKAIIIFSLLFIAIFSVSRLPSSSVYATGERNSCFAQVSPLQGIAGETKFSISGEGDFQPGLSEVKLQIVNQSKRAVGETLPAAALSSECTYTGGVCFRKFGPTEFGPVFPTGDYRINVTAQIHDRGGPSVLCPSNLFTIEPNPIPQAGTCDPSGIDPKTKECRDPRCKQVFDGKLGRVCKLGMVFVPTPTAVPTGMLFKPKLCNPPGGKTGGGIETAVGCIPSDPNGFVAALLRIILGIAGGVAVLLIIFSGYRMATSAGNPEQVQGARETITAAIVGLLFIIFSLVILEVIGVDILRIPGFGP